MKARFLPFLVILAALFACYGDVEVSAATGKASSVNLSGEISPGAVWSLTGDAAVYGPSQKNAAALAVYEINKSGMIGAAKLKLIREDDRSTKEGAIPAFDRLIKEYKGHL